jgi:flavodoxin I
MPRILVLYYSRTGNTEKMATAVAEGARTVRGATVELAFTVTPEELADYDAIAIGTPTYHHDTTNDMKDLLEQAAVKNIDLKGKIGATFGSFGWSGEAPCLVLEILKNKFQMRAIEPPLMIKYEPDQIGLERCKELGKKIAEQPTPRT